MKVHDSEKIFEIKVALEAEMTAPTVSGKVEGRFEMTKKNLAKNAETTITVNWSGGGSIKNPSADWTIESLKNAAAAFLDLVAICPQRTNAILTKYTALESFHKQNRNFSPMEYENAGKKCPASWEARRAGQNGEDMLTGAKVADRRTVMASFVDAKSKLRPVEVFKPTFGGLIKARQVCRFKMAKIVNEVDLIAKFPNLLTQTTRDSYFLNPLIFRKLLPVSEMASFRALLTT